MTSAIFLRGARGGEYVIVAKHDVLDMWSDWNRRRFIDDVGEATIRALINAPPRWLGFGAFDDPYAGRESLEFALDEVLRFGRLVPVRIEPTWRRIDPPPSVRLRDLIGTRPDEPTEPLRPTPRPESPDRPSAATDAQEEVLLGVRLVLDDGASLNGTQVILRAPGGATAEVVTDPEGAAVSQPFTQEGVGRVTIAGVGDLTRCRPGMDSLVHGPHHLELPFDDQPSVDVATHTRGQAPPIVVVRRPVVHIAEGGALRFLPESAMLVPLDPERPPYLALASAWSAFSHRQFARLLIVGHASPDGSTPKNEALASRRATCVRHLLTEDRDAWVALASQHGSPADVQHFLSYLASAHGWPTSLRQCCGRPLFRSSASGRRRRR